MSRAHLSALALSALSTQNSENVFGEQSCNCWVLEWLFRQSCCLDILTLSDAVLETSRDWDSSFATPCHHLHTCHCVAKVILPTNRYWFPLLSQTTWNTSFLLFEDCCILSHNLTSFWFSYRSCLPHSCYPVSAGGQFCISWTLPDLSEIFVTRGSQSQWLISSSDSATTN